MTAWRDARFKKALEEAPDTELRPQTAVAERIRAAARKALPAPEAPAPVPKPTPTWWQRLWHSSGNPRAPWNAAFATVLLAVLVTVLWVREPIPDARPIGTAPVAAQAPPPAPGAAPETAPAPAEAVNPALPPLPAAPRARAEQPMPAQPPVQAMPAPVPAKAPVAVAPVQSAEVPSADQGLAASNGSEPSSTGTAQKESRAALADQQIRMESARVASPRRDAPLATAPIPAPYQSPSPAAASVAKAAADAGASEAWTMLSLELDATHGALDPVRGQPLLRRVRELVAKLVPSGVLAAPVAQPLLRLTVRLPDQTRAVFSLWPEAMLWQHAGQPDVMGGITPAEALALVRLAKQALAGGPGAIP